MTRLASPSDPIFAGSSLQLADVFGQGRLGQVNGLGRPAEVPRTSDGEKGFDLTEGHFGFPYRKDQNYVLDPIAKGA
jgi:hypothetical protein